MIVSYAWNAVCQSNDYYVDRQKEFCRFASNLTYYLSQELRFYQIETRKCPCAMLGDGEDAVSIDFIHYKTSDEAEKSGMKEKSAFIGLTYSLLLVAIVGQLLKILHC